MFTISYGVEPRTALVECRAADVLGVVQGVLLARRMSQEILPASTDHCSFARRASEFLEGDLAKELEKLERARESS